MNTFYKHISVPTFLLALSLVFSGCENSPTDSKEQQNVPIVESERPQTGPTMINSEASFPVFKQDFNHNSYPWNQVTLEGGLWCGSTERVTGSDDGVRPSTGRAFARVRHGECISPFSPLTSAPGTGPIQELMSSTFPESGYVQQVDVYLDPDYPSVIDGSGYYSNGGVVIPEDSDDGPTFPKPEVEGVVLTYAVSVCQLNENNRCPVFNGTTPNGLKYFPISVTKEDGTMEVAGHEVTEAGWYTFRYRFDSDDAGNLTVDFGLMRNDNLLSSVAIENTLNTNQSTSTFKTNNLGSGYSWFASIANGLALPIDAYKLQPGK